MVKQSYDMSVRAEVRNSSMMLRLIFTPVIIARVEWRRQQSQMTPVQIDVLFPVLIFSVEDRRLSRPEYTIG